MGTLVILAALYMLPWLIAMCRKRDNCAAIFALNLFTGWSFIGWIGSLVWAMSMDESEKLKRRAK